MHAIDRHLVLLAGAACGALVLLGAALVAVRGVRLWRSVQRAAGRGGEATAALGERVAAVAASADALSSHVAEAQEVAEAAALRAAELGVLARFGAAALKVLRAPLAYLGR